MVAASFMCRSCGLKGECGTLSSSGGKPFGANGGNGVKGKYLLIIVYVAAAAAMLFGPSAAAQTGVAVEKEDGRFVADIEVPGAFLSTNTHGFFESIKLHVQWWGLLGQPVEYYKLKWEIGPLLDLNALIDFDDGMIHFLRRADLERYPDLVKRYDNLKPVNLELEFSVKLSPDISSVPKDKQRQVEVGSSKSYFFCVDRGRYGNGNRRFDCKDAVATKTVRETPHLMIVRSGETGDNITPLSPRNWRSFVDWETPSDVSLNQKAATGDEADLYARNSFRGARSIFFGGLRIKSYELPLIEIKAIYEAYLKREAGEEDADEIDREEDDFWSGEETEEEETSNDGFWNGEADETNSQDEADFWAGEDVQEGKKDDRFWNGETGASGREASDFEIKYVDGKQGVLSADGRTLIPFRDWEVLSYRSGIAKVQRQEFGDGQRCKGWDLSTWKTTQGLVDTSGNWLVEPTKTASAYIKEYRELVIRVMRNPSERTPEYDEAVRRADRRKAEEERECRARLERKRDELVRNYRAEGYEVE